MLNHLPDTIHSLNLDGNKLTDEIIPELSSTLWNFHELNYLSLKNNEITGNGLYYVILALKSKRGFQYLDLSNNPIDEQYFKEFLQLKNLEYLAIDGCHVLNDEDLLSNLAQSLPKLQCLHLCNNPVDKNTIDKNRIKKKFIAVDPIYTSCCSEVIDLPATCSASSTQNLTIIWLQLNLYLILIIIRYV